jgi:hypothetical protein
MLGTSGVVFGALIWVLNATSAASSDTQQSNQRRWLTLAAGLNLVAALTIVAGVLPAFPLTAPCLSKRSVQLPLGLRPSRRACPCHPKLLEHPVPLSRSAEASHGRSTAGSCR